MDPGFRPATIINMYFCEEDVFLFPLEIESFAFYFHLVDDTMADQKVYIRDEEWCWVPALLLEQTGDKATVLTAIHDDESEIRGEYDHSKRTRTSIVSLKDYPNRSLPLQNVVEGQVKERADMIELGFLHEAAILFNLKERHAKNRPYTRTGDIIIAVNPFRWLPIYTEKIRLSYARALIWDRALVDHDPRKDIAPHIYETSALAYSGLSLEGVNQSILVSGESGAGKTETVKIAMRFLATVVQREHCHEDTSQDDIVITRVLDSNPLLEAFGNAKTRRNDNSSRFGKYIQLQFSSGSHNTSQSRLEGSICQVYLLERSRVVRHDDAERTFHIFYQLCAADDSLKTQFWTKLKGTTYSSFSYVGKTDTTSIEGVSDKDRFHSTMEKLALIGIEGPLLQDFMRAIICVLQIGNLRFGTASASTDQSKILSQTILADLAELVGISGDQLERTFTSRVVKVRREETHIPLRSETAKDSADALAKQLYEKLFLWLVDAINSATRAGKMGSADSLAYGLIGLLDIFGFESFPTNGFEQLCINYANEQLQSKFTKDVFVTVFEEYQSEGIGLEEITYRDNMDVLDLIQNRTGLLAMLNEECIRPNGSDFGFVNKALHINKDSPVLIIPRIVHSKVEFGIRHYAGDIQYDATGFVTQNQDTLPTDLLDCIGTSTNFVIAEVFRGATNHKNSGIATNAFPSRKKSNLVAPTVWSKYKEQLKKLLNELESTQSRYIRCIKPNFLKKPGVMQHALTLEQLRSSGVVAAVTLARSAFPNRIEHSAILDRFYSLWPRMQDDATLKEETDHLLSHALRPREENGIMAFVMGNSRTYFRAGALEYLEAERLLTLLRPTTIVQSLVRGFLARQKAFKLQSKVESILYDLQVSKASKIQTCWRCCCSRNIAKRLRNQARARERRKKDQKRRKRAASQIQCGVRIFLARIELEKRHVQQIKDQAKFLKQQKKLRKMGRAATMIQSHARGSNVRSIHADAFEKLSERRLLKGKIAKLHKKISQTQKNRKNELDEANNEVENERATRKHWEETVLAASEEADKSETAKIIEFLQGEHRKLQGKANTIDGTIRPFKKNFDALMSENQLLRHEFAETHSRNESIKANIGQIVDQRNAAELKARELKQELQSLSKKFMPLAHGTLDFQKALTEIVELLEKRCKDSQLIEDINMMVYQATLDASKLQAAAEAAHEADRSPQKPRKTLGGSFSHIAAPKTPLTTTTKKSTKPRKRVVQGALDGLSSPHL